MLLHFSIGSEGAWNNDLDQKWKHWGLQKLKIANFDSTSPTESKPQQDTCEILWPYWDWSQPEMELAFGTASSKLIWVERSAPNESRMETDSPAWHAKSERWCWMETWKHAGCKETGLTKSNVYIYIYIFMIVYIVVLSSITFMVVDMIWIDVCCRTLNTDHATTRCCCTGFGCNTRTWMRIPCNL